MNTPFRVEVTYNSVITSLKMYDDKKKKLLYTIDYKKIKPVKFKDLCNYLATRSFKSKTHNDYFQGKLFMFIPCKTLKQYFNIIKT